MGKSTTLFRQIQAFIPWGALAAGVAELRGDRWVQKVTCRSHLICLLCGLLLHRPSLRAMERALSTRLTFLRRFGLGSVDCSTVSHANEHRPCDVMTRVYNALRAKAHAVAPPHTFPFPNKLYTIDSTVVEVCEALFPWSRYTDGRGAVKLHLLLDHNGLLPNVVCITGRETADVSFARQMRYEAGSVLCFDRGYFDSAWFQQLTEDGVLFVTRMPRYVRYRILSEHATDASRGVLNDQTIQLCGCKTSGKCTRTFRLITYRDPVSDREWLFLTNQMTWDALTICEIYHARWQIELFFKWIKQHLRVTTFYGRSENAVRWQLMVALCLYLLLALIKLQSRLTASLYTLRDLIETHLFDRVQLHDLLHGTYQFQT